MSKKPSVIQPLPPHDANEWDCQCARCGSSCDSQQCEECLGDGFVECDEWDDEIGDGDGFEKCPDCIGNPVRYRCMSSPEWCEANPMPGRELVERGQVEWFVVRDGDSQ